MHFALLLAVLAAPADVPPPPPPAAEAVPPTTTAAAPVTAEPTPTPKGAVVLLKTSMGDIKVEVDREKAPISTDNFLKYVRAKHYDGTIFHRVIRGFMIQGGGMNVSMIEKTTRPPIKNEHSNGLKNVRGAIAMARLPQRDSATAQFFINVVDNAFLDRGDGYAVFGKVVEGMDVVDKIVSVPTHTTREGMSDVPRLPVTLEKATVLFDAKAPTLDEPAKPAAKKPADKPAPKAAEPAK
jgi:peptidyl-prolyl cis-trans isomerase A (cyclophilin A)